MLKKNIVANDSEKEKITQQRNNIIEIKNKTRQEINKEVFKTKPNRRKDLPNIRIK
jgi:hypothetical protein